MAVNDNLKIQDGRRPSFGFVNLQNVAQIVANKIMTKQFIFGDCRCNRMKIISNLKIQDCVQPHSLISKYATNNLNCGNSNTE